jgi:hypothetical protein
MASLHALVSAVSIGNAESVQPQLMPFKDGWSTASLLWIYLYHDLLFAAVSTNSNISVVTHNSVTYTRFVRYFEQNADIYVQAHDATSIDEENFLRKRNDLVPAKLFKIDDKLNHSTKKENIRLVADLTITPHLLEEYKKLRGGQDLEQEIARPERHVALWKFLNDTLEKEHPWLYSVPTDHSAPCEEEDKEMSHQPGLEGQAVPDREDVQGAVGDIRENDITTAERAGDPDVAISQDELLTRKRRVRPKTAKTLHPLSDTPDTTNTSSRRKADLSSKEQPPAKRSKKTAASTKEPSKKPPRHWELEERQALYRFTNIWCKKDGVDTISLEKHNEFLKKCTEYINAECFDLHQKQKRVGGRNLEMIHSQFRNQVEKETKPYKDHPFKVLFARAQKMRERIGKGEDFPDEERFPEQAVPEYGTIEMGEE